MKNPPNPDVMNLLLLAFDSRHFIFPPFALLNLVGHGGVLGHEIVDESKLVPIGSPLRHA